jgi:glutamate--cysteine ligase
VPATIPTLTSPLTAPLLELERRIIDSMPAIEHWLRLRWQERPAPFYGSVDLRNAAFKIAPVDMNLFPGGFNNLSEEMLACAAQAARSAIEHRCPDVRNLLLIPERHTRNQFYLTSVARLTRILRAAGVEVRIGSLAEDITQPTLMELPNDNGDDRLLLEPLVRHGARLGVAGFDPCVILLNNDLSAGTPPILRDPTDQVLLPPLHAGWTVRRKSLHFAAYDEVAADFARLLSIDPWLVNPYFARCNQVDFHAREGEECLAESVDWVLTRTREKYREHAVAAAPFVIVKADAGTYGMGIMTVRDAAEVRGLNRKQRNKMAVVKDGLAVRDVIIQEGVPTVERADEAVAEPVVYMIDRHVVGGFYRVNRDRGIDENLNAPGMHFVPIGARPFPCSCSMPDAAAPQSAPPNRFYVYGVIARLALLAASIELERTAHLLTAAQTTTQPAAQPAG